MKKDEQKLSRKELTKRVQEGWPMVGEQRSEEYGWNSITAQTQRDLSLLTQKRMQDIAVYLYDSNPIAHRIPEIMKDFVIGDGYSFDAKNPKVKKVLDDFWNDPDNDWEIRQEPRCLDLSLFGEQCYPVFVNKYNGHVKMGYIDPGQITAVRIDANNPEIPREIYWQKMRNQRIIGEKLKLKVINIDKNRKSKTFEKLIGDCFYFSINKISPTSRGRSDLLCLAGDTLINTTEGDIPIKNLVGKENIRVYSWDERTNQLIIGNASKIRKTGENKAVVKIHFTNGDSIITTPDHPILLIDAKAYRKAEDFLASDRVQALSRTIKDGYVWVQYKKFKWQLEHRFLMEKFLGRKLQDTEVVHHLNGDSLDNRFSNLELMSRAEHAGVHIINNLLSTWSKEKQKRILTELMQGNSRALGNKFHLTKDQIAKVKEAKRLYYQNLSEVQRKQLAKRNKEASLSRFQPGKRINQYATFNHEVASVESFGFTDVYNLEVEKYHNFSANGIIVHNCVADWIDGFDQFLFARLERANFLNNFVWDILCEGMTKDEIEEFAKGQIAPKPGSMRFHNEKIKWEAITPKLEAADASEEARLFKNQILGGKGYPEHWFAEGSRTTRATAQEMGLPTLKMLKSRQRYFTAMIRHIFNFVIDQAIIYKELDPKQDLSYSVMASPIIAKDIRGMALTMDTFVNALKLARDEKWISDMAAKRAFQSFVKELGIHLKEIEEMSENQKKYEESKKK